MRADKRRATFGASYYGIGVTTIDIMPKFRSTIEMIEQVTAAFNAMVLPAQVAARNLAAIFAQLSTLNLPDDDEPEWYGDGPNPWDAHTMTFDDTLDRIDHTLNLHDETIDVDGILTSLGPEFDDIPDSPYGSAYTPEEWPAVLSAFRGIRYGAVPRPLSEFRRVDGGGMA